MPKGPDLKDFNTLVKHLSGLGYRERRKTLWRRNRPRQPRFLYKFRSFDASDSTSVERLRDILLQSRLRLSSPTEFNDPYDMAVKIVVEGTAVQIRQRLERLLTVRGMKFAARQRELNRMMANQAGVASRAESSFRETIRAFGVCSFGGDPRSILMWSHYARDHRGVCLQFELARDVRTFAQALPVNYSQDYPILNWVNEAESVTSVLLRKYKGWEYEHEQRITLPDAAGTFIYFRPVALPGMIIGCSASDETVERLNDLIRERSLLAFPPLKLYRTYKHDSKYRIIIKKERTVTNKI